MRRTTALSNSKVVGQRPRSQGPNSTGTQSAPQFWPSRQALRMLLETVGAIPWTADLERRRFTAMGVQAERLFGYPIAIWFKPDFWLTHMLPDDRGRMVHTSRQFSRTRPQYVVEYRMMTIDGRVVWIHDLVTVFSGKDGRQILQGFMLDVTAGKQTDQILHDLSGRLITAQEEERSRIARELHDDISQRLALLAVELEILHQQGTESSERQAKCFARLSAQINEISSDLHSMSHQLHPSKLEQLGLAVALKGLCREVSRKTECRIICTAYDIPALLDKEVALCLYRVAQEAIHNALKHSGAREVKVELKTTRGMIQLSVSDNGKGFEPDSEMQKCGLGLISMRERLRLVHGSLLIQAALFQGVTLEASVPIPGGQIRATEQKSPRCLNVEVIHDATPNFPGG